MFELCSSDVPSGLRVRTQGYKNSWKELQNENGKLDERNQKEVLNKVQVQL